MSKADAARFNSAPAFPDTNEDTPFILTVMRYGLLFGILLLLGIGEYAFVEFAPLPPQRRMAKLERVPVIKHFIKNPAEKAASDFPDTRRRALNGSTWHKVSYYLMSPHFGSSTDSVEAEALLKADTTALAQFYLEMLMSPQRTSPFSEDGLVLTARMIVEDLHPPDMSNEDVHKYASQDSVRLAQIVNAAQNGNPEAKEVMTRLKRDHHVDLESILSNWNGGHFATEDPS